MSLVAQVLVLVLSFPAVGLLLYVLTVVEIRMLSNPPAGHRHASRPARARERPRAARRRAA